MSLLRSSFPHVAALLALSMVALQAAESPLVKPSRYFNDFTKVVPPATADRLNERLAQFERETSNQLLVAIYSRMLTDSSLEEYCTRAFESWGVGQKDKDNGAVLFVFLQDRKMRIQTGYGLEASLTDAECFRIIEGMKPFFRAGDYAGGVTLAVDAMIQATKGEYQGTGKTLADQKAPARDQTGLSFVILVLLFVCFKMYLDHRRNRERGYLYGPGGRRIYSPTWMDTLSWGTHGSGWSFSGTGGSRSGGGGGGFSSSSWSGGGGSTGGGGASGSW